MVKHGLRKLKRKITACVLTVAITITGVPIGGLNDLGKQTVQASTKELVVLDYNTTSKTVNIDLTGDSKTEKVGFQVTAIEDSLEKMSVTVDGKTALTLNVNYADAFIVNYVKMTSKNKFLWIRHSGSNDDSSVEAIYRYDKTSKKLKKVLTLESVLGIKGSDHLYSSVLKTAKNSISVKYSGQLTATGQVVWTYTYKYKNGKFSLKSSTAKISKQAHKGDFVAKENITFYKKAGSKKTAYSVKPGAKVKLKKIKKYKKTYYLQFTYGKKTGWISAAQYDIFKDVLLAG